MSFELPLGLSTFRVSVSVVTDVEVNGLPSLPSSVNCFARLSSLKALRHPHLCRYLDAVRKKPERLFTVTEAYNLTLNDIVGPVSDLHWLSARLCECFSALCYLRERGLVHSCLNPLYIMLDNNGKIKIAAYGLYYVTGWGKDVDFPVADPTYSAPEVFCFSPVIQSEEILRISSTMGYSTIEKRDVCPLDISADVWSLGLIFLELLRGREVTAPLHRCIKPGSRNCKPFAAIRILLEGLRCCDEENPRLSDFLHFGLIESSANEDIRNLERLCHDCLYFDARLRPKPDQAVEALQSLMIDHSSQKILKPFDLKLSVPRRSEYPKSVTFFSKSTEFLSTRVDLAEVYYYWCLAGGNLDTVWKEAELCDRRRIKDATNSTECLANQNLLTSEQCSRPPVLRIPNYLALMRNELSNVSYLTENWPNSFSDERLSFYPRVVRLPCQRLLERIERIPLDVLYPLLLPINQALLRMGRTGDDKPTSVRSTSFNSSFEFDGTDQLSVTQLLFNTKLLPRDLGMELHRSHQADLMLTQPVTIKERDVEYQVRRICLFNRLLNALPATDTRLRLEVRTDIPPFLRARIWSALLGVNCDQEYRRRYSKALCSTAIDLLPKKAMATSETLCGSNNHPALTANNVYGLLDEKAANQISVDLPRCHAYDPLLASPLGQASLRRVLVATLLMHPGTLEYTQGMDSVAAVFVRLYFPDEALASACLNALLRSKLATFFSTDGFTHGLKRFFDTLLRLFAFHNPSLAVSLTEMNVPLVGLTTGWIYTLFAHAMPLDRVELLWDTLMIGPASLSFFFYLAIFYQLDQQVNLEVLGLEQICTILSNFPEVDLDRCRMDALRYALATPVSLTQSSCSTLNVTEQSCIPDVPIASTTEKLIRESSTNVLTVCVPDSTMRSTNDRRFDFGYSAFYARLCLPDAWPEHLECPETESFANQAGENLSLMTEDPLIPLIDAKDALEHMIRPDCVVIDVRPKDIYAKGCIAGSMYRSPDSIQHHISNSSPSFKGEENTGGLLNGDWEVVDHPSGTRRQARVLPSLLVNLMSDNVWKQAVHARREASRQQLAHHTGSQNQANLVSVYYGNCPGLTMIVGGTETSLSNHRIHTTAAIQLANWLIHQDVDRVCVLKGGLPALLALPNGSDVLVYPPPFSVTN